MVASDKKDPRKVTYSAEVFYESLQFQHRKEQRTESTPKRKGM